MTFSTLIKQPWFQILIGIVVVIALILGIFYYGKSKGRAETSTAFQTQQATLLKKAQDALATADKYKALAESDEAYADKLKTVADQQSAAAATHEAQITQVYTQEQQELKTKYANDTTLIHSDMSNCDRCRDLCQRSNALTAYGPEFASAKCDTNTDCADSCNTGDPAKPGSVGSNSN